MTFPFFLFSLPPPAASLPPSPVFAWEAYEHGTDIHTLADPTKLELMHQEFRGKKEDFKGEQQQSILEKYGGEEHLDAPPKEMLLAQTVSLVGMYMYMYSCIPQLLSDIIICTCTVCILHLYV